MNEVHSRELKMTSRVTNRLVQCLLISFLVTFQLVLSNSTVPVMEPCASQPCENDGSCLQFGTGFLCRCHDGFTGLRCEISEDNSTVTACAADPCVHGECVSSAADRFSCMCSPGWKGTTCEIDENECLELRADPCGNGTVCKNEDGGYRCEDPCSPNPCSNGGSCSFTESSPHFVCHCPSDFEGDVCDILVETDDECQTLNFVCQNGGSCFGYGGAAICYCLPGFQGVNCEINTVPCTDNPCQNGGTCTNNQSAPLGFECACSRDYQGLICEEPIPPCLDHPCQNGGTCENVISAPMGYRCLCEEGYEGDTCELEIPSVCTFEGVTYQEDGVRHEDCNTCHCQAGSWHCTDKFCGEFTVSFAFIQPNKFHEKEEFSDSLKNDIASYFHIDASMIQTLKVTGNPSEVEFQLKDTADSNMDLENVAADMLRQFVTGTYSFHYKQASYSINSHSVVIERHEGDVTTENETTGSGQDFINITLIIVCVVVSSIFILAVTFGIAMIVVYKRRSRKEKIYRKEKNISTSNNVVGGACAINYHKNVYNPVPAQDVPFQVAEIRLQNGRKPDNLHLEARV